MIETYCFLSIIARSRHVICKAFFHFSKVTTCRDRTEAIGLGNATATDDEVGSRYIVTNKPPKAANIFEANYIRNFCGSAANSLRL